MDSDASNNSGLSLSDIGDYTEIADLGTISVAGMFTTLLVLLSTRIGGFGGLAMNAFFDMFGIEGLVAMVMLVVVLFQITRYLYTVLYEKSGKTWSPFVFICFLLGVHLVHDLVFFYGVISQLPKGKNDMIDILRAVAADNKLYTIAAHSVLLILTAFVAMIIQDVSDLSKLALVGVILYLIPYGLAIHFPKPAPPPPPKKEEPMKDMRGNYY
jgi:hypothetical protein